MQMNIKGNTCRNIRSASHGLRALLVPLEKFLMGPKKNAKKLADHPGLKAAAAKVGGFDSGAFAYENQKPIARVLFNSIKENPDFLNDLVGERDSVDANTLPRIAMPNRDGFVTDPRPDIAAR